MFEKKNKNDAPLYELTQSQDAIMFMLAFSRHKQVTQIPTSLALGADIDFDKLEEAVNIEIKRNDCLRIRLKKAGVTLAGGKIPVPKYKQYFLPEYEVRGIKRLKFDTDEQKDAFFGKDAGTPIEVTKDEVFRIYFFTDKDGKNGLYFNVSHLIMDAYGVCVFYFDLLGVYLSLVRGTDLPKPLKPFEEVIKDELAYLNDKEAYEADRKFYEQYLKEGGEPYYTGVHGHEMLDKQRIKEHNPDLHVPDAYTMDHDEAEMLYCKIPADVSRKLLVFCQANNIAPEAVLEQGFRTYASVRNFRQKDIYSMLICNRRTKIKTKYTGGCMMVPFMFRTIISEDKTFMEALDIINAVRIKLYQHMNFPYATARAMSMSYFRYRPTQAPAFMMFSWIPVPPLPDGLDIKFDFKFYNMGYYVLPLYMVAMPNYTDGTIDIAYLYRPSYITEENLRDFNDKAVKVIEQGLDDPGITVGELLDSIDEEAYH